jgi:acetate kinase
VKILALNCGSSSIKFLLYDTSVNDFLIKGAIERLGQKSKVSYSVRGKKETLLEKLDDHLQGVKYILELVSNPEINIIHSIKEIDAVGHRVVHGADKFSKSVIIDEKVLSVIKDVSGLAPLHNPANVIGIEAATEALPGIPQIAVFDTAFHQTIPDYAYLYAVPYEWYENHQVRRYGFHGSSHLYVSKKAAEVLDKQPEDVNLITMHIGNGVSVSAIKGGKCVDTSMGLTPLEGAIMGTRSGNIDPAIIPYIVRETGLSLEEVENILNKKSGLKGITGKYSDRRDVVNDAAQGDYRCSLAIAMEAYRLKKYIGSYYAVLNRVDAIIFTAGVGENNYVIREKACENLQGLGIELDKEKNKQVVGPEKEEVISTKNSKVKVIVIPTNEEIVMIEDIVKIVKR